MSEKNFVFQSRFSFPRKGRNRISRIHSFERTKSWTNMSEKTGENERSRLDDALSNVDYEGKSNDFFSFSSLLLLPARSKPTCSGSRIRGPAFTFDFLHAPFSAPARIATYESFSSHSTSLLSYINKEEQTSEPIVSKSILHCIFFHREGEIFSLFSKLKIRFNFVARWKSSNFYFPNVKKRDSFVKRFDHC